MINRIKKAFKEVSIEQWKITEEHRTAKELYFIGKRLDMNRSSDVLEYTITVYNNFIIDDVAYTGSSSTTIDPSIDEACLLQQLTDTKLAAGYVRNKAYTLSQPDSDFVPEEITYTFDEQSVMAFMPKLIESIYDHPVDEGGKINSVEIFIKKYERHIVTSTGIDVSTKSYNNLVEVVVDFEGETEAVELMFDNNYGDFNPEALKRDVSKLISNTKNRAIAKPMFELKGLPVILGDESVKDIMGCYLTRANAQMKYDGLTAYEIGQSVHKEQTTGDQVTIDLLPILKGSTSSRNYDIDGFALKPLTIIKEGILQSYSASTRFASYLDILPTGSISNYRVGLGETSREAIMSSPYVEITSFSDLNVNAVSGDIGGEIRLAKYFDGVTTHYLTGGSISTNLSDIEKNMKLSNKGVQLNNYVGPDFIVFNDVDILA